MIFQKLHLDTRLDRVVLVGLKRSLCLDVGAVTWNRLASSYAGTLLRLISCAVKTISGLSQAVTEQLLPYYNYKKTVDKYHYILI